MALSVAAGASWAVPGVSEDPGGGPGGVPGGAGRCLAAVLLCGALACGYVGSLYVWGSPLPR